MAYVAQDDPNILTDLIHRKEFYWHKRWPKPALPHDEQIIPRFTADDQIARGNNLRLQSYQQFVAAFMSPATPYQRLLLQWQTGTGKTVGALSIAMQFIKFYRIEKELAEQEIGSVFVIGFSEMIFKNELLRFPEFGFLSRDERRDLDARRRVAQQGTRNDVDKYREMLTRIKRRFSNRKLNGFFRFYGYKAFVNRIFLPVQPAGGGDPLDISVLSEEQIREALRAKTIVYNEELLKQFKNSLIICDEIHNVYNSAEKNNWGIAIQAVLDAQPSCRAVFMSATPLNNSPTEIVDLLNLLLPVEQRVHRRDFFAADTKLKPGALDKIAKLVTGRVSFLRDVNPKYYPAIEMIGEQLKQIPYLRFVRCPMSSFHYRTYKQVYTGAIPADAQYIVDFCLENPDKNASTGLYQTTQIKSALQNASQRWRETVGLDFRQGRIVGHALERKSLVKYSSKMVAMLDALDETIAKQRGKTFIYHNIVHMSGVLFIAEVLNANGYLDDHSSASDNTICMRCGKRRSAHSKAQYTGSGHVDNSDDHNNANHDTDDHDEHNDANDNTDDNHDDNDEHNKQKNTADHNTKQAGAQRNTVDLEKEGRCLIWRTGDKRMLTICERGKKGQPSHHYQVRAGQLGDELLAGHSAWVRQATGIFMSIAKKARLDIQIPASGAILRNWLLIVGFHYKTTPEYGARYTYLTSEAPARAKTGSQECQAAEREECRKAKIAPQMAQVVKELRAGGKVKVRIRPTVKPPADAHKFQPARYILVHGEIDKQQIDHSIEKFNSTDNTDGSQYLILVGARVLKESHDIKAIQTVMIMGRPDNIPTLLQIRGRAIRKNSHRELPPEKRVVRIMIFTSCLPERIKSGPDRGAYQLSYEELKYKEKIAAFQVVQQIEKVMHENAIDAAQNMDMIKRQAQGEPDPLEALPFVPTVQLGRPIDPAQLITATFNVYHKARELAMIKTIVARLFTDISTVWKAADLLAAIKEDTYSYETEVNSKLFDTPTVWLAIKQLSWVADPHVTDPRPVIRGGDQKTGQNGQNQPKTLPTVDAPDVIKNYDQRGVRTGGSLSMKNFSQVDHRVGGASSEMGVTLTRGGAHNELSMTLESKIDLLSVHPDERYIILPGRQISVIVPIVNRGTQYFVLCPLSSDLTTPVVDAEVPYRIAEHSHQDSIDMQKFIRTKRVDFDYNDKRRIFFNKYAETNIEDMENVVCEYGTVFHIKFLEECIEYIFRAWTDPTMEMSDMHDFYFKMLYYYDLLSLVLWAYTCKPRVFKDYVRYAIPVHAKDIKLKTLNRYENREEEMRDISPADTSDLATSGVVNLLKSSINRTSNVWIPAEFREEFNDTIEANRKLFAGKKKKSKQTTRVTAKVLPIGHFINRFPNVYHPDRGWVEDPMYIQRDEEYIENDVIIGYDEKSKTGVHVRFKLRNPIHNIKKYRDARLIEKGTVCRSKSKPYLQHLAKKLDIQANAKSNVEELCTLIRSKLIRMELIERIKKSRVKYFYFHYEEHIDSTA